MNKKNLIDKECAYCHKHYKIKENATKKLKYCSAECHILAQKTQEHQELYKKSLKERYGVDRTIDIPGCREKKERTMLERYGVKSILQRSDLRNEWRKKCKDIYGDEYPQRTEAIKEKVKQTCLAKYGATSILGSREFRDQLQVKLKEKFGIEHISQLRMNARARSILESKESFEKYITNYIADTGDSSAVLMYNDLQIDDTTFYAYLDKYGLRKLVTHNSSHYEKEIRELFPTINFVKDRTILDGKEIDLYAPDYKIGIEFNGNYWHSDAIHTEKDYHLRKSELAQSKGVFLYHVFEYEWNNSETKKCIIDRLKTLFKLNKYRIHARKCSISLVSAADASEFYQANHLQGKCPAQVHLGLYSGGDLYAVMSFKTNGINTTYQWELCRYACKAGYTIPGGASKLFKYFIKNYNPTSIISYSDIAKTTGKIYKTLGFTYKYNSHPQYVWASCGSNCKIFTRYQTQIKQLIKLGWKTKEDGLTEDEVMYKHKFHKIYDCGKCVWVWRNNSIVPNA